jgi:transglutaminase-like putative cysteine protease
VLTARGADAFRRQGITWTPDRQEVHVERARIVKPDGAVVESHEEQEESASEPWYRLYYDLVARTVSFPALAPGDVVEVAWRVDDTAGENLLSDYFGDVAVVDEEQPKARFDWVLLVPEARAIHASAAPGITHSERKLPGGLVEHRFAARDLPRLVPEPAMPGQAEVARLVHVSTYESWDEVNRFYWRLVRDQLRAGPELAGVAERIAASVRAGKAGAAGPGDRAARAELVRAAYAWVVTQTRYVGLEFGIHGYKPYRVDQVLSRRFGDCKDKASLLQALLSELGIDARLVLLRMRRMGRLPEQPASLAVFNHAIVYVPELDLWLDGTASYSGTRDLPQEDRGATVLVVNPDGPPRFGTIPDATAEDNRLAVELRARLAPDGSASAEGTWQVRGVDAPGYRRAYGVASERRAQLEQALNRAFPGVKVLSERVSDLSRLEDDVDLGFSLAVPRFAQPEGDGLRFLPFGSVRGYAEAYAPLSARKHDLDLGSPRELAFTYRTALPPGWRLAEVPEAVERAGPGARFSVRYRQEEGALVAEGQVVLTAARVSIADYPAFRELMVAVDRALARRVRVAATPGVGEGGR